MSGGSRRVSGGGRRAGGGGGPYQSGSGGGPYQSGSGGGPCQSGNGGGSQLRGRRRQRMTGGGGGRTRGRQRTDEGAAADPANLAAAGRFLAAAGCPAAAISLYRGEQIACSVKLALTMYLVQSCFFGKFCFRIVNIQQATGVGTIEYKLFFGSRRGRYPKFQHCKTRQWGVRALRTYVPHFSYIIQRRL